MSLDFSGAEKKIDQDKVIRVDERALKPFPVPRPNKE
jgi:hypothetical protein